MFLCLAIDSSSNNMLVPRLANRARSNPNAIPSQLSFAMPSIGPQIPAHLLKPSNRADSDDEDDGPQPVNIGPRIPAHLLSAKSGESKTQVFDDDDDDWDYDMEELDVGGTTWKVKAEILPRKETVLGALLMHQLDARALRQFCGLGYLAET